MGTVRFTAGFSGGYGTLDIVIDGQLPPLSFLNDGYQDVDLPPGPHVYAASGAAAPGPGGNVRLDITGDVLAASPKNYGPGPFPPDLNNIDVL